MPNRKKIAAENKAPSIICVLGNMLFFKFYDCCIFLMISAKAGRVTKMPTETEIIVVSANPLNNPAPAQNRGSIAAIIVKKAPTMINKALFILSLMPDKSVATDSSIITIWSFTPVPMPAIIPAMLGASRFHLINAAIPKVIKASENIVKITAEVILSFLYLIKRTIETAAKTINPRTIIFVVNSFPRDEEIVSSLAISNL